jgi:Tol biopolymer transport system component
VDLEQPGVAVKLNAPLVAERDVRDFALSPDGSLVAYRADQDVDDMNELYLVSLDNPGQPAKLNPALAPDTDVLSGYVFSPDGTKVLYASDQEQKDLDQLYLVDVSVPGVSTRLNPTLVENGGLTPLFAFSPDGATVAYVADQLADGVYELFAVDLAAPGTATRLNGELVADGDVCDFRFSPDSSRIAYCADQDVEGVAELYGVELAAPGASVKLNPTPVAGGELGASYEFSPDGSSVLYLATQDAQDVSELYRVDFASPGVATKLNAVLTAGGNVWDFRIHPDGSRIAYVAEQDAVGVFELYEVAMAEPGVAVKLNPQMSGSGLYQHEYVEDGSRVVYVAAQDGTTPELYVVEPAAPAVSRQLNAPLATDGRVWEFQVSH